MIEICASDALVDGGRGVRFEVSVAGRAVPAFVVRFGGIARAYLNRCAHVAMELDWAPGQFFDRDGEALICASHGALYEPGSGDCISGPCAGRGGLRPLQVFEDGGVVYWRPDLGARPRVGEPEGR